MRAPLFLAYLDASFLFLGLDAVELRIGSAKQVLLGINTIADPRVTDGHPQCIRYLGTSELVANRRTQVYDVLLRRRLLKHHELIATITCDKATRRRADLFERSRYDLEGMIALNMSIPVVNLLKAVSVHHKQIHIIGPVSTREQRQHIGLKTVAIVKASQRVGRDQLLLADDVEQQDAQRYTDTKARYRKHHLEGTTHQSGNRKEGKSAINGLLLQAFDFSSMDKGMQGRIYDVAVANNG